MPATSPTWMVWSDFGGVLTPEIEGSLTAFCAARRLSLADLRRAMMTVAGRYGVADPMEPIDRPLVSEEEWLRKVSAELGGALPLTTLADVWFDNRPTNLAWVDVLHRVRSRGIGVGLLSNMVPTWDAHWRRMVDVDSLLDHVVLSFEVGHRKPEPEMFDLAARLAGVPPQRCILVDDLAGNCAGARAAGWQAVHFTDTATAANELATLLPGGTLELPRAEATAVAR